MQVATHGENTGYEVPCLIVAAKDDLDQCSQALQESTRVSTLACNFFMHSCSVEPSLCIGIRSSHIYKYITAGCCCTLLFYPRY